MLILLIFCFVNCVLTSHPNINDPGQYQIFFQDQKLSNRLVPSVCVPSKKPVPNYYWRKYEGEIPGDAIVGGHTPSGNTTFIGQVLVTSSKGQSGIIPGVIYQHKYGIEAPFYGVYTKADYIAILCSTTPESLQWKQVNQNELHTINDYLVVGGYETNQVAYIGRTSYKNNLIPGKVFNEHLKGLRIATPDGKELLYTSFEILIFEIAIPMYRKR